MPRALVYTIYNLLLPLALLIGLPSFLIKGIRRGGLARNFRQRLGFFREETLAKFREKEPIWIHAVSVGEVFIALKIIEEIREQSPGVSMVLSTTTTTGYRVAAEKEAEDLTVIHNPVDLPFVTSRVIRLISPSRLVLIEAEIWPNLVRQLKKRSVPVLLINARLSPRSEIRYKKVLPIIEPVFSLVDGVTVPFEADIDRWSGLGIDSEKISVLGSVKFDQPANAAQEAQVAELRLWLESTGMPPDNRVILGGSTHPGEEIVLNEVVGSLRDEFPNLALVVVPRHAERGGEIARQLSDAGANPVLRVANDLDLSDGVSKPRVWIANTTGELRSWYSLAEAVFVGKSFCAVGGQNPVEPVLAGKPVIVGPRMENFLDVVNDLLAIDGLIQIKEENTEALIESFRKVLSEPEIGKSMAQRGAKAMARHKGATERNVRFILDHPMIEKPVP